VSTLVGSERVFRRGLAVALVALAVSACGARDGGAADDGTPDALLEVERFAFVPGGAVDNTAVARIREWVQSPAFATGEFDRSASPLGANQALLVDMYEVTRAEWLRYEASRAEKPDPAFTSMRGAWDDSTADWPATCMTQLEAANCAQWRGFRLLTAGEWLYCALGHEARPYPWGSYGQASIANTLELGLERPAPVGTFEAGRTPQAVADLIGNVAEWVADLEPSEPRLIADSRVSALGGSFRSYARAIYDPKPSSGERVLLGRTLAPDSRADDIGLRCCVSAADYLWAHAKEWGTGASARARLVALGRRWGRHALPVLESLATRPEAPAALDALAEGARQ
jgi:hypothetical protein